MKDVVSSAPHGETKAPYLLIRARLGLLESELDLDQVAELAVATDASVDLDVKARWLAGLNLLADRRLLTVREVQRKRAVLNTFSVGVIGRRGVRWSGPLVREDTEIARVVTCGAVRASWVSIEKLGAIGEGLRLWAGVGAAAVEPVSKASTKVPDEIIKRERLERHYVARKAGEAITWAHVFKEMGGATKVKSRGPTRGEFYLHQLIAEAATVGIKIEQKGEQQALLTAADAWNGGNTVRHKMKR